MLSLVSHSEWMTRKALGLSARGLAVGARHEEEGGSPAETLNERGTQCWAGLD